MPKYFHHRFCRHHIATMVIYCYSSDDEEDTATIKVDGCCLRNGQSNAQMGTGVYWPEETWRNRARPVSRSRVMGPHTNQRAELIAALRGAQQALDCNYRFVRMYLDSEYVVKAVNEWVPNCLRRGIDPEDRYKNGSDMMRLYRMLKRFSGGYSVNYISRDRNEDADRLAREGALQAE